MLVSKKVTLESIEKDLEGASKHVEDLLRDKQGYPIEIQQHKRLELVRSKILGALSVIFEYNKETHDSK